MEDFDQRIKRLVFHFKENSLRSLCKNIGISQQSFTDLKAGKIEKFSRDIFESLHEVGINPVWVETGQGNMLIDKPIINIKGEGVPYYDIDATASFKESFNDIIEEPQFFIDFKPFNQAVAYINVVGDSMYPKLENGAIIAIKEITNRNLIDWGKPHFVVTDAYANNMKVLKTVHQHIDKNFIILRSSNPNYAGDMVVNLENIISLFVVVGKISKFEFS